MVIFDHRFIAVVTMHIGEQILEICLNGPKPLVRTLTLHPVVARKAFTPTAPWLLQVTTSSLVRS